MHTLKKYRQCVPKKWRLIHRACAEEVAHVIFTQSRGAIRLDVYACPFCDLYHLGHTPITRTKQRSRARKRNAAQTEGC